MAGDQSSLQKANQKLAGGLNNWLNEITHFIDNFYDPSGEASFGSYGQILRKAKILSGPNPVL